MKEHPSGEGYKVEKGEDWVLSYAAAQDAVDPNAPMAARLWDTITWLLVAHFLSSQLLLSKVKSFSASGLSWLESAAFNTAVRCSNHSGMVPF